MTIDTYGLQGFLQWSCHAVKEKAAVEALAQAAFRALQRQKDREEDPLRAQKMSLVAKRTFIVTSHDEDNLVALHFSVQSAERLASYLRLF